MKSLLIFGILFVAASSGHRLSKEDNRRLQGYCGKPVSPHRTRRSIHTRLASRSEAPWVASIMYTLNWSPNISLANRYSYGKCSGSLISPRHVLTAAHCIDGKFFHSKCKPDGTVIEGEFHKINVERYTINFTETSTPQENGVPNFRDMSFPVSKIFYSSNYQGVACQGKNPNLTMSGDIAVFELKEDVPFSDLVYPACLNERELRNGEKLTQFGYGLSNENYAGVISEKLRIFESVVSDCGSEIPTPDTVCDFNKYKSACSGDSGSGKVVFSRRGVASVAAITSSIGMGCDKFLDAQGKGPHIPIPANNINVINHLHWICAATGICVSREIEEDVEEYERLGFLGEESTQWYKSILPLKNYYA